MIAVDTNILVYAYRADMPWHERARDCVESLGSGSAPWAIPMHCLTEFVATVTRARLFPVPTPLPAAIDQVDELLAAPNLVVMTEGSDYWPTLRKLLSASGVHGGGVHDARIAAVCLCHGVSELWTADKGFSRFPQLVTRNPLLAVNERRSRYRARRPRVDAQP